MYQISTHVGTHLCRRSKAHHRLTPSRRTKCRDPSLQHSTPSLRCRTHNTPPCSPSRSAALCNVRCAPWWTSNYRLQQETTVIVRDRLAPGSMLSTRVSGAVRLLSNTAINMLQFRTWTSIPNTTFRHPDMFLSTGAKCRQAVSELGPIDTATISSDSE